jgi:hypothetical protein
LLTSPISRATCAISTKRRAWPRPSIRTISKALFGQPREY